MANALYNIFVPGIHGAFADLSKLSGGHPTTERPVNGTMYYGIFAGSTTAALLQLQAVIGQNYTEAPSVYLQSNDTRQNN